VPKPLQSRSHTFCKPLIPQDILFQHGIVINLLGQIIQSNTPGNFTSLFITLPYWNVNPKIKKCLIENPIVIGLPQSIQNLNPNVHKIFCEIEVL
jgi:hypothetical protein